MALLFRFYVTVRCAAILLPFLLSLPSPLVNGVPLASLGYWLIFLTFLNPHLGKQDRTEPREGVTSFLIRVGLFLSIYLSIYIHLLGRQTDK